MELNEKLQDRWPWDVNEAEEDKLDNMCRQWNVYTPYTRFFEYPDLEHTNLTTEELANYYSEHSTGAIYEDKKTGELFEVVKEERDTLLHELHHRMILRNTMGLEFKINCNLSDRYGYTEEFKRLSLVRAKDEDRKKSNYKEDNYSPYVRDERATTILLIVGAVIMSLYLSIAMSSMFPVSNLFYPLFFYP